MRTTSTLCLALLLPLAACDAGRTDDARPAAADELGAEAAGGAPERAGGATPAGDFEGMITATTTSGGEAVQSVMWVKGPRLRLEMEMEGERGALIRDADGRILTLSESARQYVYMPHVAATDTRMSFTSLGRSETVAGYPCEYYRISDPDGVQDGDEICVTTALGFVGIGPAGPYQAADEAMLRQQFGGGFLILKSPDTGDGVSYEVTRIERTAVGDDRFTPPAGYTEMQRPAVGAPPRRP